MSLTRYDSEPGRVVSVELVIEEDAEVISDMNHTWVYISTSAYVWYAGGASREAMQQSGINSPLS